MKLISPLKILLLLCLAGCVNLKQINDYSSTSSAGIKKFENIGYSFKQHCIDACHFEAIKKFEIKRDNECDCNLYKQADSVTQTIYNAIKGYFDGLTCLSNNELTTYNLDPLKKSLKAGSFGNISIDTSDVNAYSKISKILLKATTDLYRKKKIKKYVASANVPLQVLLTKFQFILQTNLEGELNWKKDELYRYYKKMRESATLSDLEKGQAVTEYYRQLSEINNRQKQIDIFSKSINVIAEGHQKLYDNRNKISAKDLKDEITKYSSNIKDIISEFNKIKQ